MRQRREGGRDGDVISVDLDVDTCTLTLRKNDTEEIGAIKIQPGEYRLAVALYGKDQVVSFV